MVLNLGISNFDYMIIYNSYSLVCLMSTKLGCKDIGIRQSEFVAKTQFLWTTDSKLKIKLRFELAIKFWTQIIFFFAGGDIWSNSADNQHWVSQRSNWVD